VAVGAGEAGPTATAPGRTGGGGNETKRGGEGTAGTGRARARRRPRRPAGRMGWSSSEDENADESTGIAVAFVAPRLLISVKLLEWVASGRLTSSSAKTSRRHLARCQGRPREQEVLCEGAREETTDNYVVAVVDSALARCSGGRTWCEKLNFSVGFGAIVKARRQG
jgi:hypothetical protein